MKSYKHHIVYLFALLGLAATLNAAEAGGNVLLDYLMRSAMVIPNELTFSLTQEFRYNDNIDETKRSEAEDSFINDTTLSLKWTRTVNHVTYGVVGNGNYEHYFHKRENDDSSDFSYSISPILIGDLNIGLSGKNKLMISLDSSFDREEIDNSKNMTTGVWRNSLKLALDMQLTSKISLVTTGTVSMERYEDDRFESLDNDKYGVSLSPSYEFSKRTRVGLTAGVTRNDYRRNTEHDDYDDMKAGMFIEHIFSERTAAWIEGGITRLDYRNEYDEDDEYGYGWVDYDDDEIALFRSENTTDWYVHGRLIYQLLENVSVGLNLERDIEDSTSGRGSCVAYSATMDLSWRITGKLTLNQKFGCIYRDEHTDNNDSVRYEYDLMLQYQSSHGIVYYCGWNAIVRDYSYQDDKDFVENEWRVGAKLSF